MASNHCLYRKREGCARRSFQVSREVFRRSLLTLNYVGTSPMLRECSKFFARRWANHNRRDMPTPKQKP